MALHQRSGGWQPTEVADRVLQPLPVGVLRVLAEERELGVQGFLAPGTGPGNPHWAEEPVVLAKSDEHGGEHPCHGSLGNPVIPPGDPRGGGALLLGRPPMLALPVALASGVGAEPRTEVILQCQHLLLQVGGQRGRRGHDEPPAGMAICPLIQSRSRRKNCPGAASGSGRPSITGPWLPCSCGTSTQIAWVRRVARSARGASMARWPYLASGATSASSTGRVPSGAPAQAASIASSTAGRLRWTRTASPAASLLPGGAASAARTVSHGSPAAAACARIAPVSTAVAVSSLSASTPMARNDLADALSASRWPTRPPATNSGRASPTTVGGRELSRVVSLTRVGC